MGPHITRHCPGYDKPEEWWNTPKAAWQTWPGAHLPDSAHPPGTNYSTHNHVPMYPSGTTCAMLCEQDAHFPIDWSLYVLIGIAVLVYIVWPWYVLKHLVRKSVYGDNERFQANHEAYRAKMGAAAKGKSEMEDD